LAFIEFLKYVVPVPVPGHPLIAELPTASGGQDSMLVLETKYTVGDSYSSLKEVPFSSTVDFMRSL
jgi:hypothetical protein